MNGWSRTWPWWRSAATALALSVSLLFGSPMPAAATDLSNLVRQDCGGCHGLSLKGGLGKPLTVEHLAQWDREQITQIILNGVPGTPMPPWRPLLSEEEARTIADMLKQGSLQ
jgi:cytochrome c55X